MLQKANRGLEPLVNTAIFFLNLFVPSLATGALLAILWHWFIGPTFNVRDIGLIEAAGIHLSFVTMTAKMPTVKEFNQTQKFDTLSEHIDNMMQKMALGFGFRVIILVVGGFLQLFL